MNTNILNITAREILDSRANPTIEATVILEGGACGSASVPSGASVGKYEAHELRDRDPKRYGGAGVLSAIHGIENIIAPSLIGMSATDSAEIDAVMQKTDNTENKSNLGANAILAVSLATARAASVALGVPLYKYLGTSGEIKLPVPMLNILNGGAHASNNLEIQEFMIVPVGIERFSERLRAGSEIYKKLASILRSRGYSTSVGDEGGYAPNLSSDTEACELILEAIEAAGYDTDKVKIALDVASSEWYDKGEYKMAKSGKVYTSGELCDYYSALVERYPIISIEDGVGEEDYEGWKNLSARLGDKIMLVGDDLFVTNEKRVKMGIDMGIANSVLIKPNQIGTLTETLRVIKTSAECGYKPIISHRSGETEDSFIADLAVATRAPYIKSGAPCRSERLSKYNRLLAIEAEILK
ncbi:MAG: phosphopyruvate hydratase [Clostridia bacterium]|nr:phosphopyruvate hydratase [Clostridia bacterium]